MGDEADLIRVEDRYLECLSLTHGGTSPDGLFPIDPSLNDCEGKSCSQLESYRSDRI